MVNSTHCFIIDTYATKIDTRYYKKHDMFRIPLIIDFIAINYIINFYPMCFLFKKTILNCNISAFNVSLQVEAGEIMKK